MGTLVTIAASLATAVAVKIISDDSAEIISWLRIRILRAANAKLPRAVQERFTLEWEADIADQPGEIAKLIWAFGCYLSAAEIGELIRSRAVRIVSGSYLYGALTYLFCQFLLIFFIPLFVIIGLASRREGGPIFRQTSRLGKDGREFGSYQFQIVNISKSGQSLPASQMLTPLRKWLREMSKQTLPFLFNVARGQMTLIGPRPRTKRQFERLRKDQKQIYLRLKPGILSPNVLFDRHSEGSQQYEFEYFLQRSIFTDLCLLARVMARLLFTTK